MTATPELPDLVAVAVADAAASPGLPDAPARDLAAPQAARVVVLDRRRSAGGRVAAATARGPLADARVTVVDALLALTGAVADEPADALVVVVDREDDAREVVDRLRSLVGCPGVVLVWTSPEVPAGAGPCSVVSACTTLDRVGEDHFPYLVAHAVERARSQRWLRRMTVLMGGTTDIVVVLDSARRIAFVSGSEEQVLGHPGPELLGTHAPGLVHPDDRGRLASVIARMDTGEHGGAPVQLRARHADGSWRWLEVDAVDLTDDPSVVGIVLTARDISERKATEAAVARLAFHDQLTGLPNRMTLMDRLTAELAAGDAPTLVVLDIDSFRTVNEALGHSAADGVLAAVADRLRGALLPGERLFRLDGDRFALLAPTDEHRGVSGLRRRTSDAMGEPVVVDQGPFRLTISGGAATPAADDTADALLGKASRALELAKERGRPRFEVFDERLRRTQHRRLSLEVRLRRAIDAEALELVYQPIVELGTGRAAGFEALLRWTDPELGVVSPAEIVPVAEETGLILPLGRWVLDRAVHQLAACWRRVGHTRLHVAVNLSARQLGDPQFSAFVADTLSRAGVAPKGLHLEVTESVFVDLRSAAVDALREVRQLGTQIAIDDFGTGYSSLSYLKHLPADVLKVDRSFVAGLGESGVDTSIVQSIIALARSLDLRVLAEGVETERQLAVLRSLGCHLGQGFLWSPGVHPDEACAWLHRHGDDLGHRPS